MTLFKTSVLNGLAVLTRVFTALVLNKVLAIYVGPTGYGLIGQFQNLISMVTSLASGAIGTGVTKYTAEYADAAVPRRLMWQTAFRMGIVGALVMGVVLVMARGPLAQWLLHDAEQASVFIWLAFSLVLMILNGLMLAVLNGLKAIRAYVLANIAGSVIGAGVSVALVLSYGLYGALVALCVSQAVTCLVTASLFRRHCELRWAELLGGFDPSHARKLTGFALMAITSALVVPGGQLLVRGELGHLIGWHDTGLWQALHKISDLHLMLLTSTLTVYFLPRFSELPAGAALRAEVARAFRFVVPVVLLTSTLMYLLRGFLVRTLLTDDFLQLTDAMAVQVLGDCLKVCAWVAGFTLISHAKVRLFIIIEVVFTALFVGSTLIGAHLGGLIGTAAGYAVTYAVCLITNLVLFHRLTRASESVPLVTAGERA